MTVGQTVNQDIEGCSTKNCRASEMRLLNTHTLQPKEFLSPNTPPYAILSHTWGSEEVLFHEIQISQSITKEGFIKIQSCCSQAKRDGYEYAWIDTCCIDKSSSAELSEALNSMYCWYKDAEVCYVYLVDVPKPQNIRDPGWQSLFATSRWFTRGWTLQELIAPRRVIFYSDHWEEIGNKLELCHQISEITGIDAVTLEYADLSTTSAAQKMSWASKRTTTRPEDMAYCLMGIFGVQMTMLYGERQGAFIRLQRKIAKEIDDQSLFAWEAIDNNDGDPMDKALGLFACSPASFVNSSKFVPFPIRTAVEPFSMSNKGLRIQMPLIRDSKFDDEFIAVLACGTRESIGSRVGIRLLRQGDQFVRLGSIKPFIFQSKELKNVAVKTVYISRTRIGPWAVF